MEAGSTLAFRTCLAAFEGLSGGVNVWYGLSVGEGPRRGEGYL